MAGIPFVEVTGFGVAFPVPVSSPKEKNGKEEAILRYPNLLE